MIELCDFDDLNEDLFSRLSNSNNSPYQNYGWLSILNEAAKRNPVLRCLSSYKIAVLRDEKGIPMILAPIVLNRFGRRKKTIMIWGYNMSTDYTDLLYANNVDEEIIASFIKEILKATRRTHFFFSSIPESSITYKALQGFDSISVLEKHTCVHVPIEGDDYSQYFLSLSKNVRQNIRTAYNRLEKDNMTLKLQLYNGGYVPEALAQQLQYMYEKRRSELNASKQSAKYFLIKLLRKYSLNRYSFMKEAMIHNSSSLVLVFYVDNEIAAFGHALVRKGTMNPTFMQICYNERYRRYSPGILMLSEFLKKVLPEKNIEYLDLALGDEKYKYDLGGIEHYTVSAIVKDY